MVNVNILGQERNEDGYIIDIAENIKELMNNDSDVVCIVDGYVGCLSGDTLIRTNRASLGRKHTIKWMYNQLHNNPDHLTKISNKWNLKIPTFVRSFDGHQIRLHKIQDVVYSGKKPVHLLELVDGKKLKCTNEHKVMTQNGFKEYSKLDPAKDLVMCDTPTTSKHLITGYKVTDAVINHLNYHPFAKLTRGQHKRVEVHRLIYEAKINDLNFDDYIKILINDKEKAKTLKYVDIAKFCIHHVDGNHFNNLAENLALLTYDEHSAIHAKNAERHFHQGVPLFVKIKRKSFVGIEDTYDIVCDEPYHNFNANGIITHNSGKSTMAQILAGLVDPTFCIERIHFDCDSFKDGIINSKKKQVHILDEGNLALNIRRAMSSINVTLTALLSEIRQKNLCIIICLPSIFDLDKNVAIHRSLFLLHTYTRNGKRGFWKLFGQKAKNKLFTNEYARRSYQYITRPSRYGQFDKGYLVDEVAYRKKKDDVLKRYLPPSSSNEFLGDPVELREAEIIQKLKNAGIPLSTIAKAGILSAVTSRKRLELLKSNIDDGKYKLKPNSDSVGDSSA